LKYGRITETVKNIRIIPVLNTGDKTVGSSYRGMSLLSAAYKMLSNIIMKNFNAESTLHYWGSSV
jgi:hypothetical protein